jgi:hypothetical protein
MTAMAAFLNERERAVIEALLVTFAPPAGDRATAAAAIVETLGRLAPHRLAKLRTLLRLLDAPLLPFVLTGRFAPFVSLDLVTR